MLFSRIRNDYQFYKEEKKDDNVVEHHATYKLKFIYKIICNLYL